MCVTVSFRVRSAQRCVRGDMMKKNHRGRRALYCSAPENIAYIFLLTSSSLADPIVVSFPVNTTFHWHLSILGMSTALFSIGLHMIAFHGHGSSYWSRFKMNWTSVHLIEFLFFVYGWITLFFFPSLTPLRSFRVFCLAWHLKWFGLESNHRMSMDKGGHDDQANNTDKKWCCVSALESAITTSLQEMLRVAWCIVIHGWNALLLFVQKIGNEILTQRSKGECARYFENGSTLSVQLINALQDQ